MEQDVVHRLAPVSDGLDGDGDPFDEVPLADVLVDMEGPERIVGPLLFGLCGGRREQSFGGHGKRVYREREALGTRHWALGGKRQ